METFKDNHGADHLTPHEGVVFAMVVMSASDADVSLEELGVIRDVLERTPELAGFDMHDLPTIVGRCAMIIAQRDGLDQALSMIRRAVAGGHEEVAYRAAVAVAAADDDVNISESRILAFLRERLAIDPMRAREIEAVAGPPGARMRADL